MRNQNIFSYVGVCLVAVTMLGCGDGKDAVHPVTGKFTINGAAAKDVSLNFHPVTPGGETGSAVVQPDGSYEVFTGIAGRAGLAKGSYKIVLKYNPPSNYGGGSGSSSAAPDATVAAPFPTEYLKPETSLKTVEVKAGKNDIAIDITK